MRGPIGGRWLLRMEDVDRPREVAGLGRPHPRDLEAFGFEWDGEVVRAIGAKHAYAGALTRLRPPRTHLRVFLQPACNLAEESRYPGQLPGAPSG